MAGNKDLATVATQLQNNAELALNDQHVLDGVFTLLDNVVRSLTQDPSPVTTPYPFLYFGHLASSNDEVLQFSSLFLNLKVLLDKLPQNRSCGLLVCKKRQELLVGIKTVIDSILPRLNERNWNFYLPRFQDFLRNFYSSRVIIPTGAMSDRGDGNVPVYQEGAIDGMAIDFTKLVAASDKITNEAQTGIFLLDLRDRVLPALIEIEKQLQVTTRSVGTVTATIRSSLRVVVAAGHPASEPSLVVSPVLSERLLTLRPSATPVLATTTAVGEGSAVSDGSDTQVRVARVPGTLYARLGVQAVSAESPIPDAAEDAHKPLLQDQKEKVTNYGSKDASASDAVVTVVTIGADGERIEVTARDGGEISIGDKGRTWCPGWCAVM